MTTHVLRIGHPEWIQLKCIYNVELPPSQRGMYIQHRWILRTPGIGAAEVQVLGLCVAILCGTSIMMNPNGWM
jgi:hypothetical protein